MHTYKQTNVALLPLSLPYPTLRYLIRTVFGIGNTFSCLAGFIAVPVSGWLFHSTGSWDAVFLLFAAHYLLGAAAFYALSSDRPIDIDIDSGVGPAGRSGPDSTWNYADLPWPDLTWYDSRDYNSIVNYYVFMLLNIYLSVLHAYICTYYVCKMVCYDVPTKYLALYVCRTFSTIFLFKMQDIILRERWFRTFDSNIITKENSHDYKRRTTKEEYCRIGSKNFISSFLRIRNPFITTHTKK